MVFELWMKALNPMMTFFKILDITNLIKVSKRKGLKINMLINYYIGKAAIHINEFYILPVKNKLMQYYTIAINIIVKKKNGEVISCDILFNDRLEIYYKQYLEYTSQVFQTCIDRNLSEESMVIGTSTITITELDGIIDMNSGIYNNPFLFGENIVKNYLYIIYQSHFNFIIY